MATKVKLKQLENETCYAGFDYFLAITDFKGKDNYWMKGLPDGLAFQGGIIKGRSREVGSFKVTYGDGKVQSFFMLECKKFQPNQTKEV